MSETMTFVYPFLIVGGVFAVIVYFTIKRRNK